MIYTKKTFEDHLKHEHSQSTFATYIKEIVYGGNDGIVTTFAVVAGFSGAGALASMPTKIPITAIFLFGLANLFADGAAMGLGNFLSIRSEQAVYQRAKEKERFEIENSPEMETEETIYLLESKGYSSEDAKAMAALLIKNPEYWLEFMMRYELELSNPELNTPVVSAVATFSSFVCFGFIPLMPYFWLDPKSAFLFSCFCSAIALCILGIVRAHVSVQNYIGAIIETLIVGGVSASIAFGVGSLFK